MKKIKLIPLFLTAVFMAFIFTSCADQSWSVRTGKISYSLGGYILAEQEAYYEALQKLNSPSAREKGILKEKIEDQPAVDWIKNKALDNCKTSLAIEELFNEMNLTLTDEEKRQAEEQCESTWKMSGKAMEKQGIGKESLLRSLQIYAKKDSLFKAIYGKDGTQAVSDEELKQEFEKNNLNYAFLKKSLEKEPEATDENSEDASKAKDPTPFTEEEIREVATRFQDYVDAISKGTNSIKDVADKFKKAENSEADLLTSDISKNDQTGLPDDVVAKLKELTPGQVTAIQSGKDYYLIQRNEIADEAEKKIADEKERFSLLLEMKLDDLESLISERVKATIFKINQRAINKFPPAIFEQNKKKSKTTTY